MNSLTKVIVLVFFALISLFYYKLLLYLTSGCVANLHRNELENLIHD